MIRSQPSSVKRAVCVATSLPGPRPAQVAPADAGVLALAVLAHHDPVDRSGGRRRAAGSSTPGQQPDRAHAGVLVEALADRQPQAPEADVVGHAGQPTAPK